MTEIISSSISNISKRYATNPKTTIPKGKEIINCIIALFATAIGLLIVSYIAYIIYVSIDARRKKKKNKVGIEPDISNYEPNDVSSIDSEFFRCPSSVNSMSYANNSNYYEGTIRSYISQRSRDFLLPPPRIHLKQDEFSYVYLQNDYKPQLYTPNFCITNNN